MPMHARMSTTRRAWPSTSSTRSGSAAFGRAAQGGAQQSRTAAAMEARLAEAAGALFRRVTLFDVCRFPDGRRSLAWRLTFQAEDRTLTDDEVDRVLEHITRTLTQAFGIALRSA